MREAENNMTLGKLLILCQRHLLMLLLWTIIAGGIGFAVAHYVVEPQYTAETELLVNQKQTNSKNTTQPVNTPQDDAQLINTYKDMITSRAVLNIVSNNNHVNLKTNQLQKAVTVTNKQNSQILFINARANNPHQAKVIANVVTQVFKRQVRETMHTNNIIVMAKATQPTKPSFPNTKIFIAAGAILGFLLGFIWMLARNLVETTRRLDDRYHGKN